MDVARSRPKHSVIICHPAEESFAQSVARRYCDTVQDLHHEVMVRDLYRLGFDPVLKAEERPSPKGQAMSDDVARELDALANTDVLVLVYPIWFGAPPAMLKGYIDRVLGAGITYGAVRERRPHPLLNGKQMLSFTSSATTRAWLEGQGAYLSLRTLFDTYLRNAFSLATADHLHFDNIVDGLDRRFVNQALSRVEGEARRVCAQFVRRTAEQ